MAKKKTTRKKTTRKKTTARATTRKSPSRKKTTRKATARKKTSSRSTATATVTPAKITSAGDRPRTRSQIYTEISEHTGLTKKEVASVFDVMSAMIAKDIGNRGPGQFTVPGLMKVVKSRTKRRPARKNVVNPFTGELYDQPAKPARNVVKVRPLKGLKEMV